MLDTSPVGWGATSGQAYLSVSAQMHGNSKTKIRHLRTSLKTKYVSLWGGANKFPLFSLAEGRQPGG